MLARLEQTATPPTAADLERVSHALLVLPKTDRVAALRATPFGDVLAAALSRRGDKPGELARTPLAASLPQGTLAAWVMLDAGRSAFEQQTLLRKGLQLLFAEKPEALTVGVFGTGAQRRHAARLAVYAAWVNGARLPERKKKPSARPLKRLRLYGCRDGDGFTVERAQAAGNLLARELTVLPPNELTPGLYRARVRRLAREFGWRHEEFDLRRLRRMGAGAFVAVARGSDEEDAAIVRLRYAPARAKRKIGLVGKGICFDTGGHNLKSARYMHGMHEDMNGSAVALGLLRAATEARLPVAIDCWMAIAQNHLSPRAYKQNEVVTALDGTTIEIVHTDAEGRMVLADTLTLAARGKPELIVDFATLTGSMHVALGERYSGVFATSEDLARRALAASRASGERVCVFPMDEDYDEALESRIADIKQCTMEGEADHILAACFLKGGLGAVASDVTGFGVAWGVALLRDLL
ncbi:MAG: leucyl aminopeptidase family protein [Betaproteobacteria bacterium]|nr:leucyl aminopeptidase family protein [Betaproteobacteria bacterium]